MTHSKNQLSQWSDAIKAGSDWYFGDSSDKPSLRQALPAVATSDTADAFLISAWGLYHGYGQITFIHKSRGYTWKVEFVSCLSFTVEVSDAYDHRGGVKITAQH